MSTRALVFAVLAACVPSSALAQSAELDLVSATDETRDEPSYDASIALHVTAISLSVLGGGAMATYPISILACSPADDACGFGPAIVAFVGGIVTIAGIGVGIAASVVHATTWSRRSSPGRAAWLAVPWADPRGAGLAIRVEL